MKILRKLSGKGSDERQETGDKNKQSFVIVQGHDQWLSTRRCAMAHSAQRIHQWSGKEKQTKL